MMVQIICMADRVDRYGYVWDAAPSDTDDGAGVTFSRISPAGEEGYPGTIHVSLTYRLTAPDTVMLRYEAVAETPTIVNLTQHT